MRAPCVLLINKTNALLWTRLQETLIFLLLYNLDCEVQVKFASTTKWPAVELFLIILEIYGYWVRIRVRIKTGVRARIPFNNNFY